ncbi:STAS domain-containing protein [Nonomuraea turcica]|uniref:STAS domain-containing protein n=1 Tax=Nonomuraea sp. G32 TaxID=3067274 RepID=UPI00273C51B7|nr:STAS domain-containing protein [Nonomuraea sp. G32]MDP4510489.1 STAS domain-containing protein [Nonomuraea sp. G32]
MRERAEVNMPLLLSHQHLPGVTVIAVDGELDAHNCHRLEAYIQQHRRRPPDQLVFDLSQARFIDSRGLRVLVQAHALSVRTGGAVLLAAPAAMPARLLQITGLADHLPVHATLEEALRAALSAAAERQTR